MMQLDNKQRTVILTEQYERRHDKDYFIVLDFSFCKILSISAVSYFRLALKK